jgi:hypothetical protein
MVSLVTLLIHAQIDRERDNEYPLSLLSIQVSCGKITLHELAFHFALYL